MRVLYSFLLYLLTPLILLKLWLRGKRAPAYRQRIGERFGFIPKLKRHSIWVHAVSVGEVQAAMPFIQRLQQQYPDTAFLITTMTPTGSERVTATFGDSVQHVYLPYDYPDAVRRFLNRTQPKLLVLMETELWPNLLAACQKRDIPVIVANARLSEKSTRGYAKIGRFTRQVLANINHVAAQTEQDKQHFMQLGMNENKITVTGSIKFDLQLADNLEHQAKVLRQQLGTERLIWIAASTHDGEEQIILQVYQALMKKFTHLLLILVPRHPERFNSVAQLCEQHDLHIARRSLGQICDDNTDVYLGDTMGELQVLFAASDIAFVGGSLMPVGGHNLLEPAAVGLPVIFGQHVFTFTEISQQLLAVEAGKQVENEQALLQAVELYAANPKLRQQAGQNGLNYLQQNRGALDRLLNIVTTWI
ncbi:lipid IV(A) 3-deoxy-D-manno-octulosonic acid transferase [Candidatus Albibeggiatoa sp. nov. NOAA]|uniref:lipid IV(A) 3-deoxy-D-manno-octulosonic acid transferase n=1 Tax=Candidatus Albibeggiatoa sp. nov. NOAA TaxID=3162724 RepID=UPI0032FA0309|nr:lipid IV(A) 3-deoxy-D-manno-octulosonic acid transferase [Thiotrichaceae bacterium]